MPDMTNSEWVGRQLSLSQSLGELINQYGLEAVQAMIWTFSQSKLKSTGDASRDRIVRARLGLRA